MSESDAPWIASRGGPTVSEYNPYAAPEVGITGSRLAGDADEGRGVWRDGKTLVMVKIARLPSRCVKCNEPATNRLKRTLYWYNPLLFLLILASPLIFIIVALIVRKSVKVEVPLCERHRALRKNGMLAGVGIFLVGIILCFSPAMGKDDIYVYGLISGIVLFFVGLIVMAVASQVVTASKIDDTHAWLKKVSPLYLATLPPLPGSEEWEMEAKPKSYHYDEL
jgi:hypothetical protein